MSAPLDDLTRRLRALEALHVGAHPPVLDEVHRALVGELDDLAAGLGGGGDRHGGAAPA